MRSGSATRRHAPDAGGGKVKADRIAALGITNQRETTIVWDRKTRPSRSRPRLYGSAGERPGVAVSWRIAGS